MLFLCPRFLHLTRPARRLGCLLLLAALFASGSLRADEPKSALTKAILRLEPEIDCPSCEDGIKHALVTARGVQRAEVDVLTNRIVILYDPARINLKALVGRIRVYGYTATPAK